MKQTIRWLFFLIPLGTYAQQDVSLNKGSHRISIAYGYKTDTRWCKNVFKNYGIPAPSHTGNAWITYEYRLNEKWGMGLEAGFGKTKPNDTTMVSTINGFVPKGYNAEINFIRILPTMTYYFISSERIVLYASAGVGVYTMRSKLRMFWPVDRAPEWGPYPFTVWGPPVDDHHFGIDWAAATGFQINFTRQFGIYGEIGLNKSVFLAGLFLNFFAKDKK